MRSISASLVVVLTVLSAACNRESHEGHASAPSATSTPQMKHVAITVTDDGFSPSEIKVKKGEPLMLMFKRTVDKTCATAVEFPELKLKKDLPLNQDVMVEIPTNESRTLTFQCGMGMYKSSIVIQ